MERDERDVRDVRVEWCPLFALQRYGFVVLTVALGVCLSSTSWAEDWAQFRGPNCSGLSTSKNLPVEFSADNNVTWSHDLGDGIACPIVVDDRVG